MEPHRQSLVWLPLYRGIHSSLVTYLAIVALIFVVLATVVLSPFHVSPAAALATVPTKMNFQGRLTNTNGTIVANGTYNMQFRMYDAASGGTLLWSEERLVADGKGVPVVNGLFAIKLGEGDVVGAGTGATPLPASLFMSPNTYLEVTTATPAFAISNTTSASIVWETPMTPRSQAATSAYAFNADMLDGLDSTAFLQGTSANNTFTGLNTFRPTTNSQNAFTIQNSTSQNIVQVDTTNAGTVTLLGNNSGEPGPWQTSANALPGVRQSYGSAVANGYVYVTGGYDAANTSSTVYYAKLNTDGSVGAWQTSANVLPAPRKDHSSVAYNGYIYVIGGNDGTGAVQASVYYAKLQADGSVGAWQTTASIAAPSPNTATRSHHSSVVANGNIYVIGGFDASSTVQNTVLYAKILANGTLGKWQTTSTLPSPLYRHSSVVANGYVYATGGRSTGSVYQATTLYAKLNADGTVGAWQTASNNLPSVSAYHSSVVANGYMYALGGYNGSAYIPSSYTKLNADGSIGAWKTAANNPASGRADFQAVMSNGYAYVIGGNETIGNVKSTVLYSRLGGVVNIGGSLDLVGSQGQTLADGGDSSTGSTGGSITAGNITAVGSLQVQGQSLFNDSVSVNRDFTVGNNLLTVDDNNAGTVTLLGNNSGEVGEWKSGGALPAVRGAHSSVTANGYVYAIGGWDGAALNNTVYYAKLNADGSVGSWQTAANVLPMALNSHSSVVANGYVYVIGGTNNGYHVTVFYAKLNADGSVGAWKTAANSLPTVRSAHSSVVANGYVYVIGGYSGTAESTIYYAKLNADGSVGSWQTAANALPAGRWVPASVTANGYMYAIGGLDASSTSQNTVYYAKLNADGSVGSWQTSSNSLPIARHYHNSVVSNGYVYTVAGGLSNEVYYAKLNADGSVGKWQITKNLMPSERSTQSSVVANGYLYTIGGRDNTNTYQSSVFYSRLGGLVQVGGSLDLVGLQGQTLADGGDSSTGSTGGSITAGNITAVGSLQVQKQALFSDNASVLGDFSVGNGIFSTSQGTNVVQIGSSTADANAVVLVLDTKNTAGDPAGANGGMYYNSAAQRFRCHENGAWRDCIDGLALDVVGATFSPASSTTYYFGAEPKAPTPAQYRKVRVMKSGYVTGANILARSDTAGTAEAISLYVQVNGGADVLVGTISSATADRSFINNSLHLPVTAGDFVQFKLVTPAWATAPTNMTIAGSLYVQ